MIIRLESIILPYKKQPRKYDCDTQCMICRELPNETVICPKKVLFLLMVFFLLLHLG